MEPVSVSPPFYELLASHHDRVAFDCGEPSLNEFLRQRARQNADRNVGITHIAVPTSGAKTILGYYTMLVRSIERESLPASRKLPPGEIGVVLLARLAVSRNAQGRGLRTQMLLRAITQTERAAQDMGIYALVVHALDERACGWYVGLCFGFEPFTENPLHLALPLAKIRQLGLGTSQTP